MLAEERGEDQHQPDVEDEGGGPAEMIETALPHPMLTSGHEDMSVQST